MTALKYSHRHRYHGDKSLKVTGGGDSIREQKNTEVSSITL